MARRRYVPMWKKGSKAGSKRYTDRRREHELGDEDGSFDTTMDGFTEEAQRIVGFHTMGLAHLPVDGPASEALLEPEAQHVVGDHLIISLSKRC